MKPVSQAGGGVQQGRAVPRGAARPPPPCRDNALMSGLDALGADGAHPQRRSGGGKQAELCLTKYVCTLGAPGLVPLSGCRWRSE